MACHLPLRKTKNVQSHMNKYFPGSFFQGPKFRITKAFHKWQGVLMCFVFFASQVCPKREQKNRGHEDWYQRIRPHWTHGLSGWTFTANRLPTPCAASDMGLPDTARPFATRTSWEPSWTWWVWLICPLMRNILRIK